MNHAPSPAATDGEAANPGPRLRRRGPRSWQARANRRSRHPGAAVDDIDMGIGISILLLNMRGYITNIAESTAMIRDMEDKPMLVVFNETFLTRAVEEVELEGYALVARRDRRGQWGGGVLIFVRAEVQAHVTLVEVSDVAERVWVMVHTNQGPYLVCGWYRPPAPGDTTSIDNLEKEWKVHADSALGTIIVGDLNVHSVRWLRHSSGESGEGRALADVCRRHGLKQLVRSPTRGEHLLDLVLSDVRGASAKVTARVADHHGVLAAVPLSVPESTKHRRTLWDFRKADWEQLQDKLAETDWTFISSADPEEGSQKLTSMVLSAAAECIPQREAVVHRSSHPWLTKKAMAAVAKKHSAQGGPCEAAAALECSAVLLAEHNTYVQKTRDEMATLKQGSKLWWTRARQLLQQKARTSSIPALKVNGEWVMDAEEKANTFVDTFAAKNVMVEREENEYSELEVSAQWASDLAAPSVEDALKAL